MLIRLLAALLLGCVVAWIYLRTAKHGESGSSFPVTLVLLAILIAMVTQVIGSNVARAFSLVGALSVVRFRTVVRDTRDTAYVIFAVVVGMAVGAANLWAAVLGVVVIGVASFIASGAGFALIEATLLLRVRVAAGQDLDSVAGAVLDQYLAKRELVAVGTGKQGMGLEYTFEVQPKSGASMAQLIKSLNLIQGVVDANFERRDLY